MNTYIQRTSRFKFKRDPDDGMILGPDDCYYDTEQEAMYYGQIGLCGCGQPEEVHRLLLDCMSAINDDHPSLISAEKVARIVSERPDVVAEMILHFLDSREVTEHGGSVYGSWLTDRGKQMLEIGPISPETE